MFCLCGKFSKKRHKEYEKEILENKGKISKTGYNATIVVIPNKKKFKEMMKYKKICNLIPTKLEVITEDELIQVLKDKSFISLKSLERKLNCRFIPVEQIEFGWSNIYVKLSEEIDVNQIYSNQFDTPPKEQFTS